MNGLPDNLEQLKAAIELVADDEAFFIHRTKDGNIVPCLLLNDTFFYASADGEDIAWEFVVDLGNRIKDSGWPEGIKWAREEGRQHAGLLPIPDVVDDIIRYNKALSMLAVVEKERDDLRYWLEETRKEIGEWRKARNVEMDKVRELEKEIKVLTGGR